MPTSLFTSKTDFLQHNNSMQRNMEKWRLGACNNSFVFRSDQVVLNEIPDSRFFTLRNTSRLRRPTDLLFRRTQTDPSLMRCDLSNFNSTQSQPSAVSGPFTDLRRQGIDGRSRARSLHGTVDARTGSRTSWQFQFTGL
jgi:hypothetical protein